MNDLSDVRIKQFKLISGEELVAYMQGADETGYILERPVKIEYSRKDSGFWFSNWMSLCEFKSPVYVNAASVISLGECTERVKETYIQSVVTTPQKELEPEVDNTDQYMIDGDETIH
mgnify:CR=1 FL=1